MGTDTGFRRVRVVDLRNGRSIDDTAATTSPTRPQSFSDVAALVLDPRGRVAWIGAKSAIGLRRTTYEVHEIGALLDSSTQIDPRSLRRQGRRISWTDAGRRRTAPLR